MSDKTQNAAQTGGASQEAAKKDESLFDSDSSTSLPELSNIDTALAAMHAAAGDGSRWLAAFGAFLAGVEAVTR